MADELNSHRRAGLCRRGDPRRGAGRAEGARPGRDLGRSYATGKRKDAVARVWIRPGSGKGGPSMAKQIDT